MLGTSHQAPSMKYAWFWRGREPRVSDCILIGESKSIIQREAAFLKKVHCPLSSPLLTPIIVFLLFIRLLEHTKKRNCDGAYQRCSVYSWTESSCSLLPTSAHLMLIRLSKCSIKALCDMRSHRPPWHKGFREIKPTFLNASNYRFLIPFPKEHRRPIAPVPVWLFVRSEVRASCNLFGLIQVHRCQRNLAEWTAESFKYNTLIDIEFSVLVCRPFFIVAISDCPLRHFIPRCCNQRNFAFASFQSATESSGRETSLPQGYMS